MPRDGRALTVGRRILVESTMPNVARLFVCLLFAWHGIGAAVEVVRFPRPEFEGDRRFDYALQLLKLGLSKTGTEYRVELAPISMNQERQVVELEADRTIDIAPIPSSAEREQRLLPIRIPIQKGVLGWRLGLIRKGDQGRFAGVNALEDLKRVRLAQGQEWPDTQILRANGIDVITAPKYEGLFKMLVSERFDYFPRSVNEIWDELDNHAATLEVEPRIALHYYYDAYFMVNKKNTRLAENLRQGLEKAIADGSFDRLFDQHHGERLRKARLDTRTVIELKNPLLTPGTPSDRPELWYQYRPGPPKSR
ncbi:transporter substrate-binding domain-containing protein [Piscinibacter sp. XHJ-5]|uniref:substrate-binding periplasmic protein n=1 Tax=Piscinibacter sp. XHJ-5 TaxID=3037797 RepID=UPI0024533E7C|nr:transporter substrate-binding domain-containing protein [Piscinibacter sp. XHJ-5]